MCLLSFNFKDKNGTIIMNVASSKKDEWYIILLWAAGANLEDGGSPRSGTDAMI